MSPSDHYVKLFIILTRSVQRASGGMLICLNLLFVREVCLIFALGSNDIGHEYA